MIEELRNGIQAQGLIDLINDLPFNLVMAEIGCWQGESAEIFLKSGKVFKFYAFDTYGTSERMLEAERLFIERTKGFSIIKQRSSSDLISICEPLDFVYIDGNHSYEWVKKDILNSLTRLKPGSIIGGHDYAAKYKDMVVKAVNEVLGIPDKTYSDTSWIKRL